MFLPPVARPAAHLAAKLYEFGVRGRLRLYERGWLATRKLPAPVISIGNLTVGGTGKTPCTAYLANLLHAAGYCVAILSRGYKRTSRGLVEVSDGARILCSAATAGDEPYLLAQQCRGVRVVVNADRYAAGMWLAQRAKVDVFLLDDSYQHIRLHRDLNLALVDAREDLDLARMLPFGRWREPVDELRRADAVIVTRADRALELERLTRQLKLRLRPDTPILTATHELTALRRLPTAEQLPLATFANQPVAVLTAIAQPERFIADLQKRGMQVVAQHTFADHHRFSVTEVRETVEAAQQAGAKAVVITEKDAANLPLEIFTENEKMPWLAAQLVFQCAQHEVLRKLLLDSVSPS